MGLFRRRKDDLATLQSLAAAALAVSSKASPGKDGKGLIARLPLRWRAAFYLISVTATASAASLGALLIFYTLTIPDPLAYRQKERASVVRILARDGSVLAERGTASAHLPLALIPPRVTGAVLATEDRRFWTHWGIDPIGLLRATLANIRAGYFAEGGSTLTQQLAKNMFLTPERTLARKAEELALAIWLELRLTKSEILELYLNRVYFGGGAYGIEAAAQRFFDKSASELTVAEAAVIAGLLKAPSRYAPSASQEQAMARSRTVLAKMREAGVITPSEENEALREKVRFADASRTSAKAGVGYAVDYVMEELPQLATYKESEIIVETTVDAALQRRASAAVTEAVAKQGASLDVDQAAAVVLDKDGGIRALVGGRSYLDSQFNRAVKARRQPGSAFKPFVYLAALEKGYTPDSIVYDLPIDIAGWAPRNDNGRYQGAIAMRDALSRSVNTVAVRLFLDAGADRVSEVARRLGIASVLRRDASLALGTSEVSMLELTSAYAVFANGGRAVEPHIIRRIRLGSGRVLYTREAPPSRPAVAPRHVAAMNDMLSGVVTRGTGRKAGLDGRSTAGKTGTSQDFRDAWFVGYTSDLAAAVWTGNDDGRAANRATGGGLPATVWREIMLGAHEGRPATPLPGLEKPPAKAEQVAIAKKGAPPKETVSLREKLPWLPAEAVKGSRAASAATRPAKRLFPKRGIDPDFLARALDNGTLRPEDQQAVAGRGGSGDGPSGRIIVRPAEGLMSLGGPAP